MSLSTFILVLSFGVLIAVSLDIARADRRSQEEKRSWRIRCVVAGTWAYEEKHEGGWRGFEMEETGDFRESPHIIEVPEEGAPGRFPSWAAGRRAEIILRLQSEWKPPHYLIKNA